MSDNFQRNRFIVDKEILLLKFQIKQQPEDGTLYQLISYIYRIQVEKKINCVQRIFRISYLNLI